MVAVFMKTNIQSDMISMASTMPSVAGRSHGGNWPLDDIRLKL